jgi:hypothetical protein
MSKRNSRDAAEQFLSIRPASIECFTGTDCTLNGQIWPALVILWDRQSLGIQTQIVHMFPQPGTSDRTRLLYIRLMVKRGYINSITPPFDIQSELSLSHDTKNHFIGREP